MGISGPLEHVFSGRTYKGLIVWAGMDSMMEVIRDSEIRDLETADGLLNWSNLLLQNL